MSRQHLLISHRIPGRVADIFAGFTEDLFLVLSPKLPPTKLIRYDGNDVGDLVEIQLGISPFTKRWVSEIVAHEKGEKYACFIDEGRELPVPLNYWRHRHLIEQLDAATVLITEDITFGTSTNWLTRLLTPIIRQQFQGRGKLYREYFADRGCA